MKVKQNILFMILFIGLSSFTYSYNPTHLKILKNYVTGEWYKWRKQNPHIKPDLSNAVIDNCHFMGDFSNVNFQKSKITESGMIPPLYFTNANFNYTELNNISIIMSSMTREKALFKNTSFYRAKIFNSRILGANFLDTNLNEIVIDKSEIGSSIFKNVSFYKANIMKSTFDGVYRNVNFSDSTLNTVIYWVSFIDKMSNANFRNSKIINCGFCGKIENSSYQNSDLTGSTFDYRKDGAQFLNVNFTNSNLTKVDFTRATFQNVIFKNADMTGAKLERKWYSYVKKQGVRNFDKIQWM